jgi:photosystem II stability/assembly factor-like uncharacterized protein
MRKEGKSIFLKSFKTHLFFISILFFFIGFNFQDSRTGGWVRQYITAPIGSAPINGIDFKDSLIGYAITNNLGMTDTNYVIKTTNGGFNWNVVLRVARSNGSRMYDFKTLNKDTLFVGTYWSIYRTYNGGQNWSVINIVNNYSFVYGLFVLSPDTMWYTTPGSIIEGGGLYRTTNGGLNWTVQYNEGVGGANGYPQSVYFYNKNIGYLGTNASELLKTTNCGVNWTLIPGGLNFSDIYFKDSLIGYLASSGLYKTTNGGLNWQFQNMPSIPGMQYTIFSISKFAYIHDTLYAIRAFSKYPGINKFAELIYKTTNAGLNWGYQIMDTTFNLAALSFVKFINGKTGWAYCSMPNYGGIRTTTGGDSTLYTNIKEQLTNYISSNYVLHQNYPNPFNPITKIKYKIEKTSNVKIVVNDIAGKEITTLLNKKQTKGNYEVFFNGNSLSSGIYFYSLFIDGYRIDTKKMILLK